MHLRIIVVAAIAVFLQASGNQCLAQPASSATKPSQVADQDLTAAKDEDFRAAKAAETKEDGVSMLTHAKRLTEKYPQSSLAYRCLADAYYYMDFNDEALAAVKTAITLNPSNVIGWHDMGSILSKQKKAEEAFAAYRKAVEVGPEDPITWSDLGLFYLAQGKKDLALQSAQRAGDLLRRVRFDTHSGEMTEAGVLTSVGSIYSFSLRGAEALPFLKRAVALEPQNANIWFVLSYAYASQKMRTEALSALQQTLKLKPDHEQAKAALQSMTAPPQITQQQPHQQPQPGGTLQEAQDAINLLKSLQELSDSQSRRRR